MRRLLVLVVLGVLAGLISVGGASASAGDSDRTFIAELSGDHQVPPLVSAGSGFASFRVDAGGTSVDYRLYAEDTTGITQAHVHLAAADSNGPVAAFLFGFVTPGVAGDGLVAEGTLAESDLIASAGFDATMASFINALSSGGAYVNLHTEANPPGELRGQILAAPAILDAGLSGDNQNPAVASDGTGYAAFEVGGDESTVSYRLYAFDTAGVTQAHVHLGRGDENGPVAAFLFGFADPAIDADGLVASGTIAGTDLIASTGFDGSMGQFLDRLRSGDAYVNLHTVANPPGELRGQIGRAAFNFAAAVSGGDQIPSNDSSATGVATIRADGAQAELAFTLLTHGAEGVTQAHIHLGEADENGGVAAFLFGFEAAGVTKNGILATGTLSEADLIAKGDFDGSMSQLLDRLRAGVAYVNVHTLALPPGEIRGQLGPLAPHSGQGGTFSDDDGNVHEGDIEVMASAGITRGCNPPANDNYCGSDVLTRGQAAAFFFRALNLAPGAPDRFADDDGTLFETEINAIAAAGITLGCNPPANDNYCPDDTITRAQWASLLVRAFGLTDGGGDDLFVDDDDSVHAADIDRIGTAGITLGCNPPTNDEYCPGDAVQRGQAASFFTRAFGWSGTTP